jgi:hypothetical protein
MLIACVCVGLAMAALRRTLELEWQRAATECCCCSLGSTCQVGALQVLSSTECYQCFSGHNVLVLAMDDSIW